MSTDFKVRLESHVHLSGLVYFADKLQVSGLKHAPDTLLFGMYNNIFCHVDPDTASPQLKQLVPDTCVPTGKVPAVVYVDQMSRRPSYSTSSLSRIHTVLRAIKQTHAAVQRVHSTIEDKLVSSSEHSRKLSQREELIIKVRQLRQELLRQTQKKQKDKDELEQFKSKIEARRERIKTGDETLKELETKTEEDRQMYIQSREMLVKENAQVLFRRKQVIYEISHYIYRITNDEKNNYYICNAKLPNAEDYHGHDETMVAVALGMTCHLTLMVSKFLNLPLRYPMCNRGSRSSIIDHIHSKLSDKEREFPLYGKGKEKFQYNYAVFLLNKNISQLRFYCGLGTSDLRETLPNLKSLLEQRLGMRGSPPHTTSSVASPAHMSFEGSLSSRPSMAPSNSTSSFAPHLAASCEHDPRDLRLSPLRQGVGHPSSGADQFDLSPLDSNFSNVERADFKVGCMLHPDTHHDDSLKPNVHAGSSNNDMTDCSHDQYLEHSNESGKENHDGVNGNVKILNQQSKSKTCCKDEEEKEDLFTSTEDNFFQVNKRQSATQILSGSSSKNSTDIGIDGAEDQETIRDSSSLWSPTGNQQSFKLVKAPNENGRNSESHSSDSPPGNSSSSPLPESSLSPPGDSSFSPPGDSSSSPHLDSSASPTSSAVPPSHKPSSPVAVPASNGHQHHH